MSQVTLLESTASGMEMAAATSTVVTVRMTCCSRAAVRPSMFWRMNSHENQGLRGSSAGAAQPTRGGMG